MEKDNVQFGETIVGGEGITNAVNRIAAMCPESLAVLVSTCQMIDKLGRGIAGKLDDVPEAEAVRQAIMADQRDEGQSDDDTQTRLACVGGAMVCAAQTVAVIVQDCVLAKALCDAHGGQLSGVTAFAKVRRGSPDVGINWSRLDPSSN